MEQQAIEQRVRAIIHEILRIPVEKITSNSKFKEDLAADSLDLVSLMMALEDELKISIPQGDEARLTTVGAVVDYIGKCQPVEAAV